MDSSNIFSLHLIQETIKRNTQTENICRIITHTCFYAILAFSIINYLNILEIPYSIVLFADKKFVYAIKAFETPHNDEIYKLF